MNFSEFKQQIEGILEDNKESFEKLKESEKKKESIKEGKKTGNYEVSEQLDDTNDAFLEIGTSLYLAEKELNTTEYKELKNFVLSAISYTNSSANLNKVIKIAGHDGIQKHKDKLPKGWGTLAIISQLKNVEFEAFIKNDKISPNTPRSVISSIVKECQGKSVVKKITIEINTKAKNCASRKDIISLLKNLNLESKGWKINLHEGKNDDDDTNKVINQPENNQTKSNNSEVQG